MQVTVTGASGTITWCGLTWNLPGDSGLTQCLCPTTYRLQSQPTPSYSGWHRWDGGGTPNTALQLYRRFYTYTSGGSTYRNPSFNRNTLWVHGDRDQVSWNTGLTRNTQYSDISKVLYPTVGRPTENDYQITNDFFGTHTDGSSITFTWSKGNNWP
jgi:hypothetical protein